MSDSRVALVTGATGAIGRAIAAGLLAQGLSVVVVARERARGERLVRELGRGARLELADLSRRASIEQLGARWSGPLHVLVQNAAIAPRRRRETPEGIELQLATNVLAHLWLAQALAPALERAGQARMVNVASYWAGDLDLSDLEFHRRRYDNNTAYRQSKQCNRMLTVVQAERFAAIGPAVNVCHPGDVSSTLSYELGFGGSESPAEGADTPLWLATSPDVAGVSGRYFEHRAESPCRFARDRTACDELHRLCTAY